MLMYSYLNGTMAEALSMRYGKYENVVKDCKNILEYNKRLVGDN